MHYVIPDIHNDFDKFNKILKKIGFNKEADQLILLGDLLDRADYNAKPLEREKIITESIGNINGSCDGCMGGPSEMYQDYIDGKQEISEINMAFKAHYESGDEGPMKTECGYVK